MHAACNITHSVMQPSALPTCTFFAPVEGETVGAALVAVCSSLRAVGVADETVVVDNSVTLKIMVIAKGSS